MIKASLGSCKNQLREKYRAVRREMSVLQRQQLSDKIFQTLADSQMFKNARTIYAYASINDEVSTDRIINYALELGKRVAVPYCIPHTSDMQFYFIDSIRQLSRGTFGVPEPTPSPDNRVEDKSALILVPALAFDRNGYRMGYGKGYYDRYLADFTGVRVGLCFSACVSRCILHGRFDSCVDYIITDNFTKFIAKK